MPGKSGCSSKIPQRWVTVALTFLIYSNMYTMRTCLSIAITEMVLPHNKTTIASDDTCLKNNLIENNTHSKLRENQTRIRYDWSEYTQGIILSSFHWGFIISSIFGGLISQKFGSKHSFSFSMVVVTVLTFVTPHGITWGGSTCLIVIRIAMGFAEGLFQPASLSLIARWIPIEERDKAGNIMYMGLSLGTIFGILPSGIILEHFDGDWFIVFYFYGTVGFVSFLLHLAFCYNTPSENRFISDQELTYLKNAVKNTHLNVPLPPWRHILTSIPVLALISTAIGQIYGLVTNYSDMPKYMSSVLKLSAQNNGLLSAIPYLSMFLTGTIASYVVDKIVNKKLTSIVVLRKVSNSIATFGSAVFLISASYAGCNTTLVTVLLAVSSGCLSFVFFGSSFNAIDLSPNFAGTIAGLSHGTAAFVSMFAPYAVGILTPNQTIHEWRVVFWIVFGILVSTNVVFIIFGSVEVQEWNDPAFLNRKDTATKGSVKESVDLLRIPE